MATLEDLGQEQRDELALLARELSDSPETRREFLALARKKRPNMPVPELDLDDRIRAQEAKLAEVTASIETKISERDMRAELERRRENLIKNGKARDESEVELIEKIMLEKGIQNHETAADYHKWMSQAATPTPVKGYSPGLFDKDTRAQVKDYWKNPIQAARDNAAQALQDLRRNPKIAG